MNTALNSDYNDYGSYLFLLSFWFFFYFLALTLWRRAVHCNWCVNDDLFINERVNTDLRVAARRQQRLTTVITAALNRSISALAYYYATSMQSQLWNGRWINQIYRVLRGELGKWPYHPLRHWRDSFHREINSINSTVLPTLPSAPISSQLPIKFLITNYSNWLALKHT